MQLSFWTCCVLADLKAWVCSLLSFYTQLKNTSASSDGEMRSLVLLTLSTSQPWGGGGQYQVCFASINMLCQS